MVDITVVRGAGDRPGPDIEEPLLASLAAALERGRAELNQGTLHNTLSLTASYQPDVAVGDLIRVIDTWQDIYTALITGITHIADSGTITTRLDLWRPA